MIDPLQRWREHGENPISSPDQLWERAVHPGTVMFGVEVSHGTPIYRLVRDGHVEVIPAAIGSADITALAGERIVREMLTGIALRRRSRTS